MRALTLGEFTDAQLRGLCSSIGLGAEADAVCDIVGDLLGPAAARSLADAPAWGSDIADDHTPLEYSLAFDDDGAPTLRLMVECLAAQPGPRANMLAAVGALDRLAARLPISLRRFDAVRELFLPAEPAGHFSLWFSIVVRAGATPRIKVYFNPEVRGFGRASRLVRDGLERLGFPGGYDWLWAHLPRPGATMDRYSFFAVDLADDDAARVKVYVSHQDATIRDAQAAASAGSAVRPRDLETLGRFCRTAAGGDGPYTDRPLISSYSFLGGDTAQPSGYSLYVPIRAYSDDDAVAMSRVTALLDEHGVDAAPLERAVPAITSRPLESGSGLLAHVSLRIGPPRPGVTVYLSAEAYAVGARKKARLGAA